MANENVELKPFKITGNWNVNVEEVMASNDKPKFLTPGEYAAKITEVAYKGAPQGDNTWGKFTLQLEATNGRQIRHMVLVPGSESTTYGTKASTYPFVKLLNLLRSAGLNVDSSAKAQQSVQSAFGMLPKSGLIGKDISIRVGYTRPHLAYTKLEGDAAGKGVFMLKLADGKDHAAFSDRTWGSRDLALAEIAEAGIEIQEFAEVVDISPLAGNVTKIGKTASF